MNNRIDFESFWEKHQGTFPGYANGGEIQEICKEIALEAWNMKSGSGLTKSNQTIHPIHLPEHFEAGLTKREYFAALVMQGLHANSELNLSDAEIADIAVTQADELIKRLNKQEPSADVDYE